MASDDRKMGEPTKEELDALPHLHVEPGNIDDAVFDFALLRSGDTSLADPGQTHPITGREWVAQYRAKEEQDQLNQKTSERANVGTVQLHSRANEDPLGCTRHKHYRD